MPPGEAPISREVARQAAHWLMLMHGGQVSGAELQACSSWRAADPEHERAWQRVLQIQDTLGLLPPDVAMGTLNRERRQTLKGLLVLAALLPVGYAGHALLERQQWLADLRTGVGERRELVLADGSHLHLNSDTAVDVLFSDEQRLIRLHRGELLLDSGADAGQSRYRPLRVETAQGILQALGTRFAVRRLDEQALTHLAVFEGSVRIQPHRSQPVTLVAAQQASFSSSAVGPLAALDETAASWTRGLLIADEIPLGQFIKELGRHRAGWLRCAPEVAGLTISGTFQLNNTEAILAALPHTLPVVVERHTRYWITLRAR